MADKKLELALITKLVDKFTGPAKKMGAVTSKLTENLSKTNEQWKKHKALTKKFDDLKRQNKAFDETNNKLLLASKRLDKLKKAKKGNTGATKKLTQSIGKQHREIAKLNTKLGLQKTKLWAVKKELHSAGIPYANMAKAQRKLGTETDRLNIKLGKQQKIAALSARMSAKWQKVKRGAMYGAPIAAGAGYGASRSYTNLEDAEINLKMSLMDKTGKLPPEFAKISAQADELGNKLRGTTADFYQGAIELTNQGLSAKLIAGGALEATSNLAVLLGRTPALMAELTAKSTEAFGLKEQDIVKFADYTQRMQKAFGLSPESINEANKYLASTLISMKISGFDKAKNTLAIEGMAARGGIEGSQFGTNYKMLLNKIALLDNNLSKKGFSDIQDKLDAKGLKLNFFDKNGEFSGQENMVKQLEQLRAKFSTQEFGEITSRLFGQQGGNIAKMLAMKGVKGFQSELQTLLNKPSMALLVKVDANKFSNKLESLGGSLTALVAEIFRPMGDAMKPGIDKLNEMIGSLTLFIKKGNVGISVVAGLGAAFVAWRGTMLTARVGLGLLTGGLPGATGAFIKHFAWIKKGGKILKWLATRSIPLLLTALRGVVFFLLANPIGIAITALATAAWLVYKNWDKVKVGLSKIWTGMKADFQTLLNDFKQKPITTLASLPLWFSKLGKNMIINLIDGIFSIDIKAKMKKLIDDMKASFKGFSLFGKRGSPTGLSRLHEKTGSSSHSYADMAKRLIKKHGAKIALAGSAMAIPLAGSAMAIPQASIAQPAQRATAKPAVTMKTENNITIHATQGMDAQQLAKEVGKELDRREWKAKQSAKSSFKDED